MKKIILLSSILVSTILMAEMSPINKKDLEMARKMLSNSKNDVMLKSMANSLSKNHYPNKYVKIEGNTLVFYAIENEKELKKIQNSNPKTMKMTYDQFIQANIDGEKQTQLNIFCHSPYDYVKLEKGISYKFVHKLENGKILASTEINIKECKNSPQK